MQYLANARRPRRLLPENDTQIVAINFFSKQISKGLCLAGRHASRHAAQTSVTTAMSDPDDFEIQTPDLS